MRSDNLKALVCALAALSVWSAPAPAQVAVEYTPQTMQAALRERDAVVDNYRIQFTRRETRRIDERAEWAEISFRSQRFGRGPAPASFPDPYDALLVENMDLATRTDSLALRSTCLTDHHGHPQLPRHYVVVERGREQTELDDSSGDWILTNRRIPRDLPSINQEFRMFYELALGVGLGRRIKTVESVEKLDDGWRVTGTFQLWTEDKTTFELETDADLFVRKATLKAVVHPRETWFEFANSGSIETEGQRTFARTGSLKRTYAAHVPVNGTRLDDGKSFGRIEQQYELEVGQLDFDLSDEQYNELSAIDAAQADYVIDERLKN